MIIATCVLSFSGANLALRLAPAIIIVSSVLVIFFITRIMSLGSIIAAIIAPIMFFIFRYDNFVIIAAAIWTTVILIAHRENIKRLFKGEEKKILRKKKEG
jgi:glycerol-3-phosphate acyltransferase PlsY